MNDDQRETSPEPEAPTMPAAAALPPDPQPALSPRTELGLEVGVVIVVGALPYLVSALTAWDGMRRGEDAMRWGRFATGAAVALQISAAVLWIMYRSRRPWREFGIVRVLPAVDAVLTLGVAGLVWGVHHATPYLVWVIEFLLPPLSDLINILPPGSRHVFPAWPDNTPAVVGLFVWNILNGFGEELVLRAYLVPRLRTLTGSAFLAVLISAAIGASYHIYQGSYAAFVILVGQAAIATLFLKVRRLWPFAIGHALYDLALLYFYYS